LSLSFAGFDIDIDIFNIKAKKSPQRRSCGLRKKGYITV
jgi:hypothetical protein